MEFLERQCRVNEQYSKRERLEISGVPESVNDNDLKGRALNLEKIGAEVHPHHIEACRLIKFNAGLKQVIIKMSRCKVQTKSEEQRKN